MTVFLKYNFEMHLLMKSMNLLEYPLDKSIPLSFSFLKTKQKERVMTYKPAQISVVMV